MLFGIGGIALGATGLAYSLISRRAYIDHLKSDNLVCVSGQLSSPQPLTTTISSDKYVVLRKRL